MTTDLPWSPASGQTALRVIERSEAFVLCEDKGTMAHRYLYTHASKLVTVAGRGLTLQARVMMPDRQAEPDHEPEPATPTAADLPARAAKKASKPKPAQMSLF